MGGASSPLRWITPLRYGARGSRRNKMKKSKKEYCAVPLDKYLKNFGIGTDKDKLREAYNRAWKNRNFEIDKFWTRSAYFWGFIAAIFAGYITVMTSKYGQDARAMNLHICLIVLGLLFSFAWLLVIKGSKRWQENWEEHIDMLENEITGPLYKTVYRKKGKPYYSVSKVNEFMAWVIIFIWGLLLVYSLSVLLNVSFTFDLCKLDVFTVCILLGGGIGPVLLFVFCKSGRNGYKPEFLPGQDEGFVARKEE
jgi:hypothetical protein